MTVFIVVVLYVSMTFRNTFATFGFRFGSVKYGSSHKEKREKVKDTFGFGCGSATISIR